MEETVRNRQAILWKSQLEKDNSLFHGRASEKETKTYSVKADSEKKNTAYSLEEPVRKFSGDSNEPVPWKRPGWNVCQTGLIGLGSRGFFYLAAGVVSELSGAWGPDRTQLLLAGRTGGCK